jgi:hypothetical protein
VLWPGLPGLSSGIGRGTVIGVLAGAFLLLSRRPKRQLERQVEPPNSHFNPPGVRHGPIATPWDAINLAALHEVNRPLVEVLLARARELGPDHLSPTERELLDRMAFATRLAAEGAGPGPGAAATEAIERGPVGLRT